MEEQRYISTSADFSNDKNKSDRNCTAGTTKTP